VRWTKGAKMKQRCVRTNRVSGLTFGKWCEMSPSGILVARVWTNQWGQTRVWNGCLVEAWPHVSLLKYEVKRRAVGMKTSVWERTTFQIAICKMTRSVTERWRHFVFGRDTLRRRTTNVGRGPNASKAAEYCVGVHFQSCFAPQVGCFDVLRDLCRTCSFHSCSSSSCQ